MNNVKSHLFVPASKEKNLRKSADLVERGATIRIIDIEDSIKDAINSSRSAKLKEAARGVLKQYLPNDDKPFQVRMNDLHSPFWKDDLELFSTLQKKMDFSDQCKGVVLAKTNSREEVERLVELLQEIGISDVPTIPLIETTSGMENLSEITQDPSVKSVMFGHHDYYHDQNVFPIPRSTLTSELYRDTLKSMVETIQESNRDVGLIDGIYPYLYDKEGMQDACRYLYQEAEDLQLGKLALNPSQVESIISTDEWHREIELTSEDDEVSEEKKREMAKELIDAYEKRETGDLGVGRTSDMYMSPQQYYMAKHVVNENNKKDQEFKPPFDFR